MLNNQQFLSKIVSESNDATLAHVGVIGMHWGVHKAQQVGGALKKFGGASLSKIKKSYLEARAADAKKKANPDGRSEDQLAIDAIKKKPLSQLSNKEIQTLAARADLETKYRQIMITPEEIKRKQTMATLGKYGGQAATLFIQNFTPKAAQFAEVYMEKKFGVKMNADDGEPTVEGVNASFKAAAKHVADTAFKNLTPGVKPPSVESIEADLRKMVTSGDVRINKNGVAERVIKPAPAAEKKSALQSSTVKIPKAPEPASVKPPKSFTEAETVKMPKSNFSEADTVKIPKTPSQNNPGSYTPTGLNVKLGSSNADALKVVKSYKPVLTSEKWSKMSAEQVRRMMSKKRK
jgi:hypothetical protein